ncbi:MAG: YegS/Rv2252/BmrU family lipid kinase [Sphingobacteriales bacterium]|nr:YegS/Rv2252/BmrU family lipid kinase [Sphingobacteriales bacterium]
MGRGWSEWCSEKNKSLALSPASAGLFSLLSFSKNIAIVCNRLAGAERAEFLAERLSLQLSGKEILHSLFIGNWPPNFIGFTDLWIVGGDGTLNYFINHYPDIKLPLVIFNGGTGNDVHWLLYGKKTFEEQLETALTGEPRRVDVGKCNEKYFINGVGIGFEGAVALGLTGKKKVLGKTSFLVTILKKIFSYRSKHYAITAEKYSGEGKKLIIDVANGQRAGGGFHIAPVSAIDDGWLDVVMVNKLHPFMRLRYLPVIEKGKHLQKSFCYHFKTKKVIIESEQPMQAHLDGEFYSANKMEIEILPGKLLFRY